MNLQAEKIQLAKLVLDTDNKKILQAIRALFKSTDVAESPATSESVAKSILAAMEEVKLYEQGKIKLRSAKELLDEL